jgi:hypothetical protein
MSAIDTSIGGCSKHGSFAVCGHTDATCQEKTLASVTEIKQKFSEPFADEEKGEFAGTFRKAAVNPEATKLFEKNVGGNVNFVAYKIEQRFGGGLMFRILEGGEIRAQITFNPEDGNVLNMVHREVQSQTLGIGGSALLQKIEGYFRVLQESGALPPTTTLAVEAGQTSVVEWAKKNSYGFKDVVEEELFDAITTGQNQKYVVVDIGEGELFDNYIFEKAVYDQHKEEMDEDPTLAKKYSVRFKLTKKLQTGEMVPQAGESTGNVPLVEGENIIDNQGKKEKVVCKLSSSENLSVEELLASAKLDQASIPYYREVLADVEKGDYAWEVTKKVKEYADYLAQHPESAATLPPLQFLNNKLHDGAHRISALYLLAKLHPESPWATAKLKVDFYESKIK